MKFAVAVLALLIALVAFTVMKGDVSPSEKRLANQLYIRARVTELQSLGLLQVKEQIEKRPIEQRERRIALMSCVYREEDRLIPWGVDLPMPDREWVKLERLGASTALTDGIILRFTERDECWHAVVWNKKWLVVPSHGSLNCLTNAIALVQFPINKE